MRLLVVLVEAGLGLTLRFGSVGDAGRRGIVRRSRLVAVEGAEGLLICKGWTLHSSLPVYDLRRILPRDQIVSLKQIGRAHV